MEYQEYKRIARDLRAQYPHDEVRPCPKCEHPVIEWSTCKGCGTSYKQAGFLCGENEMTAIVDSKEVKGLKNETK